MPTVSSAHLMCMSTHHLEGLEQLISIDELSEYLGVPVKTTTADIAVMFWSRVVAAARTT